MFSPLGQEKLMIGIAPAENCDRFLPYRQVFMHLKLICWQEPVDDDLLIDSALLRIGPPSPKTNLHRLCDRHRRALRERAEMECGSWIDLKQLEKRAGPEKMRHRPSQLQLTAQLLHRSAHSGTEVDEHKKCFCRNQSSPTRLWPPR